MGWLPPVPKDIQDDLDRVEAMLATARVISVTMTRTRGGTTFSCTIDDQEITDARDIADAATTIESAARGHEQKEVLAGRVRRPMVIVSLTDQ